MLFIVVGIAVIAMVALFVATVSGSLIAGWVTIWLSMVGLLLLLIDGLRRREGDIAQPNTAQPNAAQPNIARQDAHVAPPPQMGITVVHHETVSIATELTNHDVELRPDIWPPEHPVHATPGDHDRIEPRRASEGESLRPDIWP